MAGIAPIYSLTDDVGRAESTAWARFSAAKDSAEFCNSWLAILCMQIERVGCGMLLLGPDHEGAYTPAALWPHAGRDMQHLSPAAQRVLTERRGIVIDADGKTPPAQDQRAFVGYPIEVSGVLHGVVVLDLAPSAELTLQRAVRFVHWSSAWLVDEFRRRALQEREQQLSRVGLAMELVATSVQERRFTPSALAIATELAGRMECDRVSIGLEKRGSIVVHAISHTATFNRKMELPRRIGEAMDEVLDFDVALVYPPQDEVEQSATAHAELARHFHDTAICSVPLLDHGHTIGVLTFERSRGEVFTPDAVDLCKTIGGLVGPVLVLKRENERGLLRHAYDSVQHGLHALFGPRHPGVKLLALTGAAVIAFCSLATGTYRVAARTVIEGAVQRAVAVPFDGFIQQSFVRAGETVKAGQPMARLDDRDLKLEQTRLAAEREQVSRRQRQALAVQERATLAVLSAQMEQVDAALSLTNEKLARANLVAPFDGVVLSGDLTQLVGTPVELGKVLFQIAPLDAYRVILEVEEREVAGVAVGQRGELTLSGLPHRVVAFTVERITPVSTAKEGRNYFRVEAQLKDAPEGVRPGMEGVGKVAVGERKYIWIWTHSFVDWVRLTIWKWMP